jgi:hypothetical protein
LAADLAEMAARKISVTIFTEAPDDFVPVQKSNVSPRQWHNGPADGFRDHAISNVGTSAPAVRIRKGSAIPKKAPDDTALVLERFQVI